MKKILIGLFVLIFVVSLVFVATGCKTAAKATAVSESAKTQETAAGGSITIGFAFPTMAEERYARDRETFIDECNKQGVKYIYLAANNDIKLQATQVDNLLTQKINVLVLDAVDTKAAAAFVDQAHKEGIKVLSYDRLVENADVDLYLSQDARAIGKMMAQSAVDSVPKGNYVIIGGHAGDSFALQTRQGFLDIIQPLIDKGDIKLVSDQYAKNWAPEEAMKIAENALTANSNNIQVMLASNDGTARGAIQAIEAQGLQGKVFVTGQDAELASCQLIVEGRQSMTVFSPFDEEARQGVQLAISLAKGEMPKTDLTINNGLKDIPMIAGPSYVVTKDNMADIVIKSGWQKLEDVYKNVPKDQWPKVQ